MHTFSLKIEIKFQLNRHNEKLKIFFFVRPEGGGYVKWNVTINATCDGGLKKTLVNIFESKVECQQKFSTDRSFFSYFLLVTKISIRTSGKVASWETNRYTLRPTCTASPAISRTQHIYLAGNNKMMLINWLPRGQGSTNFLKNKKLNKLSKKK